MKRLNRSLKELRTCNLYENTLKLFYITENCYYKQNTTTKRAPFLMYLQSFFCFLFSFIIIITWILQPLRLSSLTLVWNFTLM